MDFLGFCSLMIGLCQLVAIAFGLHHYFGIDMKFAAAVAVPLAIIPLVNTGLSIYSLMLVWHWSLAKACTAFLGPLAFVFITTMILKSRVRPNIPPRPY